MKGVILLKITAFLRIFCKFANLRKFLQNLQCGNYLATIGGMNAEMSQNIKIMVIDFLIMLISIFT